MLKNYKRKYTFKFKNKTIMRRALILMILLSIASITFSQETRLDKEQEKISN